MTVTPTDKANEVTAFNRNGMLSNGAVSGGSVMSTVYDGAGNRNQVTNNGSATSWTVNNLNQYTGAGGNTVASDGKGNVSGYNGWSYTYDAQNRLRLATGGGKTVEFWYDGKNRQITRRINGDNNKITRSVWDGWNLLEERDVNDAPLEYYLYGARTDELVLRWGGIYGDSWYGYDGRGNVSHLFGYSYSGLVIETYTYDLAGAPTMSAPNNESLVENRFLFQGRDYLKEAGVYDYRNRFYHPGLGRFMQPDPVGLQFEGGKLSSGQAALFWAGKVPENFTSTELNLYRYCHNDPVDGSDPLGLLKWRYEKDFPENGPGGKKAVERAIKNELKRSKKGREILAAEGVVTIRRVTAGHGTGTDYSPNPNDKNFDTYLDPTDSRFQDPGMFRALKKHPGELPEDSDKGRAVIIGHEFAHGVFKEADEKHGGRNIRDNENAIRRDLGLPLRRSNGDTQFSP